MSDEKFLTLTACTFILLLATVIAVGTNTATYLEYKHIENMTKQGYIQNVDMRSASRFIWVKHKDK